MAGNEKLSSEKTDSRLGRLMCITTGEYVWEKMVGLRDIMIVHLCCSSPMRGCLSVFFSECDNSYSVDLLT